MQTKKTHWASILILLVFAVSVLLLFLLVAFMGISSLIDLFNKGGEPVAEMISATSFGFVTFALIICGWFVLQKTIGKEQADTIFVPPFANWQIVSVIALVLAGLAFGSLAAYADIPWVGWLVMPAATIFVIVPPIWLIFGGGSRGLNAGPRWRAFAVLGLGVTIGPAIMIVLEMVALVGLIIAAMALLAVLEPATFQDVMRLAKIVQTETDQEVLIQLLAPYLSNPFAIATGIGYIALIVPLIEELFKPLAVWIFATKIETPSQGFVLGLLSGAAFALLESLNASADGTTSWPLIVSVRAGTSILHMTASGLMGWGIVSAFKEKRIERFFGAYFAAVMIHGLWNASAAGAGLSSIGESIGRPEWLFNFAPALLGGLFVLGVGMVFVLIASNRKLQKIAKEIDVKKEEVQLPT